MNDNFVVFQTWMINKMNRDYTSVVKQWPSSDMTFNDKSVCDLNTWNSGLENFATHQFTSGVLPFGWDNLIQHCTYPVDNVTAIDQVDNFGIIYGNEDPDQVLLLYGFCKNNPSHERCVAIEQTLCSTFPYHPSCIMNLQTNSWSWVYTVLIIALAVGLGYMMSSPSNKTSSNY
jgi:hypothetical protein